MGSSLDVFIVSHVLGSNKSHVNVLFSLVLFCSDVVGDSKCPSKQNKAVIPY